MTQERQARTVSDPVCGCKVDTEGSEYRSEFEGKTYYFCTESCKMRFDMSPGQWAKDIQRAKAGD